MAPAYSPPSAGLLDRIANSRFAPALIAALAFLAAFAGVLRTPPLDRDESRYAQATAQMLETGDFVRIAVLDAPRNKKPIGVYWLQAASVRLVSHVEAREIWAYRLPSVLGAMLAAVATFYAGAGLIGRRAAFVGAVLLAVSALLAGEGQIAKTDALLCGFVALGMAGLAALRQAQSERSGRRAALLIWGAVAAGALVKGPVAPMALGLAVAALILWERRANWAKPLLAWPGPLLAGLVVLPWGIAILLATQGAFLVESLFGDIAPKLAGGGEHRALPPGVHTLLTPVTLFPASAGLPGAIALGWAALRAPRSSPAHAGVRTLLAMALPTFIVFEIAGVKLLHYPLPTHPPLALLCGAGLLLLLADKPSGWLRPLSLAVFLIGALALVAAAAALSRYMPGDAVVDDRRFAQTWLIGAVLVAGAGAAFWLARRNAAALVGLCVAAGLTFAWGVRDRMLPEARELLVSRDANLALARAGLHPRLSPGGPERLLLIGYAEPSLIFQTASTVRPVAPERAAAAAIAGDAALLEAAAADVALPRLAERGLAFRPIGPPVAGVHYNNGGRDLLLQPGLIIRRGE